MITFRTGHWRYTGGWTPDYPDPRHLKYVDIANQDVLKSPKPRIDLKRLFPTPVNQEDKQCCTACACTGAYEYELALAKKTAITSSFIFVYYNQRVLQDKVHSDSGATIVDALYTLNRKGVCSEDDWKEMFREFTKKPYESCYLHAINNCIGSYYQLDQDINQMKACLSEGHPVIFGFSVFDSIQVAQNGDIKVPGQKDKLMFGHAAVAVGYDDAKQNFIIRNSWGNSWGRNGYGTIPYDYLSDKRLSRDFWTIRLYPPPAPKKDA